MRNPLDPGYYCSQELRSFGFKAVGENVLISRLANVVGPERIEIGSNVRIDALASLIVATGYLKLGDYIHVATGCLIGARGGVTMEGFNALSQGSKIVSATDDFSGGHLTNSMVPTKFTDVTAEPVIIGRHAIIGADVLVLPAVRIGEGAAIGCKSLVNRSVPAWEIHFGVPAKKHRDRIRRVLEIEADLVRDLQTQAGDVV